MKKLHPSITKMKKLIVLHLGGCPLEFLPRGFGKLTGLQELTGFRDVGRTKSKACDLLELSNLTQLRVLHMVINNDDFEISESDLNKVFSKLDSLKVLDIDSNECNKPKVWKMLDCLYPPKHLKELYLRNYHYNVMPKWVKPSTLQELQYLCVEDGYITRVIPEVASARSEYVWRELEGLSLKKLGKLEANWMELKETMPVLRYMEVSPGNGRWINLPSDVQQSGIWRAN